VIQKRIWIFVLAVAASTCVYEAHRAQAGTLELIVQDDAGEELPCRVLVRAGGQSRVPAAATTLAIHPDTWFMSAGRSEVDVPDGEVLIRVERGTEYRRVKRKIQATGPRNQVTVRLNRWVNMRERGYLCGESHIHIDSQVLGPLLVAEGLDFGSSLTWWRGPDPLRPVPQGSGPLRLLEFAGQRIPTSIYDAELEYDWGAAYIQNLPHAMPILAEPGRPNLDYLRHAIDHGALVHYQGGWSREVLVDALLGCVHIVNICNNNFGLHRFQPRSRYSNLLRVEGFPIYPDTDVGMMRMNTETYYRLLNCGLRLAAGAETAVGVKKAPVGYNRAYVRVPSGSSLREFNEAWKAGRNFVTNGPVLFLRTAAGQQPGDSISLPSGAHKIALHLEILSDQPLTSVEVVVNGKVVAEKKLAGAQKHEITHELVVTQSCWVAALCTARDDLLSDAELSEYEDDGNQPNRLAHPSRLRFAHTSPIYITVDGKVPVVQQSVEEGLKMLTAFDEFAATTAAPQYRLAIQTAVDQARQKLNQRQPME
jgi:hypothetical protein